MKAPFDLRAWTDEEGIDRHVTEIVAENIMMLGKKPEGSTALAAGFPPSAPAELTEHSAGLAGDDGGILY